MITIQYRNGDRLFTFNRELTSQEKLQSISNYKNFTGYVSDTEWVQFTTPQYTVEQLAEIGQHYQYQHFDQMGVAYLTDAKFQMMLAGATNPTSPYALPYQMIHAMQRFIEKIWAKYDDFKLALRAGEEVKPDYSVVGEPPCSQKDLQWVVDPEYRAKDSTRIVNLDINYYINWN